MSIWCGATMMTITPAKEEEGGRPPREVGATISATAMIADGAMGKEGRQDGEGGAGEGGAGEEEDGDGTTKTTKAASANGCTEGRGKKICIVVPRRCRRRCPAALVRIRRRIAAAIILRPAAAVAIAANSSCGCCTPTRRRRRRRFGRTACCPYQARAARCTTPILSPAPLVTASSTLELKRGEAHKKEESTKLKKKSRFGAPNLACNKLVLIPK